MATRSIHRSATVVGYARAQNAPIYVDSDDNILKFIPAGSGTTEVQIVDASATQTLTNKTLTSPTLTTPVGTDATEVITGANVITAAESGTTFFLSNASGGQQTLPAVAAGLRFKFIVTTAPTSVGYTIIPSDGTSNIIAVNAVSQADSSAGITDTDADLVTFVANQAAIGDYLDFFCDGTLWYASGIVKVTAGLTTSTT